MNRKTLHLTLYPAMLGIVIPPNSIVSINPISIPINGGTENVTQLLFEKVEGYSNEIFVVETATLIRKMDDGD